MSRLHPRSGAGTDAVRPEAALLHPLWLLSLGVLVLNDHFLKGSGLLPGWITGKLSDLAGLIVAPVLFAVLLRTKTRRGVALAHVTVALGFAAMELSASLTTALDSLYRLAGFSWKSTRDLTDLLAIAMVPVAYRLTVGAESRLRSAATRVSRAAAGVASPSFAQSHGVRLLGTAGLLACTASSGALVDQPLPCGGGDCDADGYPWPADCDDYDPTVSPNNGCPALFGEVDCNDGSDDDQDGAVDCYD